MEGIKKSLEKLPPKQFLTLVIFIVFMYSLVELIKFALKEKINDPNLIVFIIVAILILIGFVTNNLIKSLAKEPSNSETKNTATPQS